MTTKQRAFAVLFLAAFVWVFLMGLLSSMAGSQASSSSVSAAGLPGGQRAPAKPTFTEDGSVKARVTNLERDKFHITLNMNVIDKDGKELGDVKEEEIVVYEDNVPVASKKFSPIGQSGLRIALAVDYGSYQQIGQDQREIMKEGVKSVSKALHDRTDHLALFINNHHALTHNYREAVPLGPVDQARRDQAFHRLDDLRAFHSGAGIYPAMGLALSKLAEARGKRVLIVLSAGRDDLVIAAEQAPTKTLQADYQEKERKAVSDLIANAKKAGIPIYMVYPVGTMKGNELMMKRLGEESGGEYYAAVSSELLSNYLVREVIEKLRKDYTVEYDSPNPVEDGLTRKVEVFVRQGATGVKLDTSYHVPGVLATGTTQPKPTGEAPTGTPVQAERTRPPLWGVLFPLGLILAALFAVPYLLMLRPRSNAAATAPPAPVAQAVPAAPVAKLVPPSSGKPTPPPAQIAKQPASRPGTPKPGAQPPANQPPPKGTSPSRGAGPEPKMW